MAHFVLIEDADQQLVDVKVYCSDSCAKSSPAYAGWFGAQEVEFDTLCQRDGCEVTIYGTSDYYRV